MPFIQTNLIHDDEENIIHLAAYRIRVIGSGNLDTALFDLNSVNSQVLPALVMTGSSEYEPDLLANFNAQRIMLRLSTDQIDEIFNITRIILYHKSLWTSFVG